MIATLQIGAALYAFVLVVWVLYLAIMNLAARRADMHPLVRIHAYALLLIGYPLDALLNLLVCLAFWRVPRDWLLTGTLKRYMNTDNGWRCRASVWFCTHWLDPFDPKGRHC